VPDQRALDAFTDGIPYTVHYAGAEKHNVLLSVEPA
jgi:hypothetical protein